MSQLAKDKTNQKPNKKRKEVRIREQKMNQL